MGEFVDLKAMPYYLSDEDVAWVEQTIAGMSDEEKIGQLFISHNRGLDVDEAQEQISRYHYGGQRYKDSGSYSREVFDFITGLRQVAKIPMLVAANCDNGGDGACADGVYIATGAAVDPKSTHAGLPGERMDGDHRRILATGIARLRTKIQYRPVVFELMPEEFTLGQLQLCVDQADDLDLAGLDLKV